MESWLDRLFHGASLDEVARSRDLSMRELLMDLTRRELEGSVVRLPGGRYAPSP